MYKSMKKINYLHFDHIIVPLDYTELHSSVGSDGIPVVELVK